MLVAAPLFMEKKNPLYGTVRFIIPAALCYVSVLCTRARIRDEKVYLLERDRHCGSS